MSAIDIPADRLAGTPEARAVRLPEKINGHSVYRIEYRDPPPTYNKGDGYDGGRNILSAVLIGMCWRGTGYVVGGRGDWAAYPEWPVKTVKRKRVYARTIARRATVREAGRALLASRFGNEALA